VIWRVHEVPWWWLPLVGAAVATTVLLVFVVLAELTGPHPPEGRDVRQAPLGDSDGGVHLAGTGVWLPLARELAASYGASHPGRLVIVHDSIGSRGGRRALDDGVIDVGLVSVPGREVPEVEDARSIAVALGAVVFAVHPSVSEHDVTSKRIVGIMSGEVTTWPDGRPIVPLLREEGDSATRVACDVIPGFAPALADARRLKRWPTLLTDQDMADAVESTPGSIGLHDLGALRIEHPAVRVLSLDGVAPSAEALSERRYPLVRTLVLLVARHTRPETDEFLAFVTSGPGREVIASHGAYLPLVGESP
jgi:phosphate transport system substrate-binding protein